MPQNNQINRRYLLNQRPVGEPDEQTLRLEHTDIPNPGAGEMLLRSEFLSLDPYMRGRMSDAPSYAPPVEIGEVMVGATVAEIMISNVDGFEVGDWVLSFNGWQDYAISDGKGVRNLGKHPINPSWALGILGMPGFTAYCGLKYIGEPKSGETLVVAAATGPVGATVGQIGKLMGCHVVGIAGSDEKCHYAVDTLGFDICINHQAPDFVEQLTAATPNGIDINYENVGGKVFETIVPLLNPYARVPVCGLVSQYNATSAAQGPDRLGWLMGHILRKKIKLQGFIIFDNFAHHYPEFAEVMSAWVEQGKVLYKEHRIAGLENAPRAFVGLLRGENFGKCVIHL